VNPGEEQPVHLLAARRGRIWVTLPNPHGVIVHGPTLRALQTSATQALALTGTASPVRVAATSPVLDALEQARRDYHAALRAAVLELRDSGATWRDAAEACRVSISAAQTASTAAPETTRPAPPLLSPP
jgi:hypothetical protein